VRRGVIDGVELTTVDYESLAKDERVKDYRKTLADVHVEKLSSNEELTLFINSYNFLCVDLILNHYIREGKLPKSINNLSTRKKEVWDLPAGVIGGKEYTLGEIEHSVLRAKWKEPRIHASIVCASVSCPDLRNEAFIVQKLNEQMDDQVRSWLKNTKKGSCVTGKNLHLSRIFNWFYNDFVAVDPRGPVKWLSNYSDDTSDVKALISSGKYSTKYMNYIWNLNVAT